MFRIYVPESNINDRIEARKLSGFDPDKRIVKGEMEIVAMKEMDDKKRKFDPDKRL